MRFIMKSKDGNMPAGKSIRIRGCCIQKPGIEVVTGLIDSRKAGHGRFSVCSAMLSFVRVCFHLLPCDLCLPGVDLIYVGMLSVGACAG
jgi:hypothetical protein